MKLLFRVLFLTTLLFGISFADLDVEVHKKKLDDYISDCLLEKVSFYLRDIRRLPDEDKDYILNSDRLSPAQVPFHGLLLCHRPHKTIANLLLAGGNPNVLNGSKFEFLKHRIPAILAVLSYITHGESGTNDSFLKIAEQLFTHPDTDLFAVQVSPRRNILHILSSIKDGRTLKFLSNLYIEAVSLRIEKDPISLFELEQSLNMIDENGRTPIHVSSETCSWPGHISNICAVGASPNIAIGDGMLFVDYKAIRRSILEQKDPEAFKKISQRQYITCDSAEYMSYALFKWEIKQVDTWIRNPQRVRAHANVLSRSIRNSDGLRDQLAVMRKDKGMRTRHPLASYFVEKNLSELTDVIKQTVKHIYKSGDVEVAPFSQEVAPIELLGNIDSIYLSTTTTTTVASAVDDDDEYEDIEFEDENNQEFTGTLNDRPGNLKSPPSSLLQIKEKDENVDVSELKKLWDSSYGDPSDLIETDQLDSHFYFHTRTLLNLFFTPKKVAVTHFDNGTESIAFDYDLPKFDPKFYEDFVPLELNETYYTHLEKNDFAKIRAWEMSNLQEGVHFDWIKMTEKEVVDLFFGSIHFLNKFIKHQLRNQALESKADLDDESSNESTITNDKSATKAFIPSTSSHVVSPFLKTQIALLKFDVMDKFPLRRTEDGFGFEFRAYRVGKHPFTRGSIMHPTLLSRLHETASTPYSEENNGFIDDEFQTTPCFRTFVHISKSLVNDVASWVNLAEFSSAAFPEASDKFIFAKAIYLSPQIGRNTPFYSTVHKNEEVEFISDTSERSIFYVERKLTGNDDSPVYLTDKMGKKLYSFGLNNEDLNQPMKTENSPKNNEKHWIDSYFDEHSILSFLNTSQHIHRLTWWERGGLGMKPWGSAIESWQIDCVDELMNGVCHASIPGLIRDVFSVMFNDGEIVRTTNSINSNVFTPFNIPVESLKIPVVEKSVSNSKILETNLANKRLSDMNSSFSSSYSNLVKDTNLGHKTIPSILQQMKANFNVINPSSVIDEILISPSTYINHFIEEFHNSTMNPNGAITGGSAVYSFHSNLRSLTNLTNKRHNNDHQKHSLSTAYNFAPELELPNSQTTSQTILFPMLGNPWPDFFNLHSKSFDDFLAEEENMLNGATENPTEIATNDIHDNALSAKANYPLRKDAMSFIQSKAVPAIYKLKRINSALIEKDQQGIEDKEILAEYVNSAVAFVEIMEKLDPTSTLGSTDKVEFIQRSLIAAKDEEDKINMRSSEEFRGSQNSLSTVEISQQGISDALDEMSSTVSTSESIYKRLSFDSDQKSVSSEESLDNIISNVRSYVSIERGSAEVSHVGYKSQYIFSVQVNPLSEEKHKKVEPFIPHPQFEQYIQFSVAPKTYNDTIIAVLLNMKSNNNIGCIPPSLMRFYELLADLYLRYAEITGLDPITGLPSGMSISDMDKVLLFKPTARVSSWWRRIRDLNSKLQSTECKEDPLFKKIIDGSSGATEDFDGTQEFLKLFEEYGGERFIPAQFEEKLNI